MRTRPTLRRSNYYRVSTYIADFQWDSENLDAGDSWLDRIQKKILQSPNFSVGINDLRYKCFSLGICTLLNAINQVAACSVCHRSYVS
ncbi:hypothetical protein os4_23280 [Comamonadaceae bacterium OS-4]|nr:hypothetical protein os4_23280 [Comamonadaceae bacterium OS-4]